MSRISKSTQDRHHRLVVSPKQAQRMAEGRVESRPDDYSYKISQLDEHRREVRLKIEDRNLERELQRMTGSGYE